MKCEQLWCTERAPNGIQKKNALWLWETCAKMWPEIVKARLAIYSSDFNVLTRFHEFTMITRLTRKTFWTENVKRRFVLIYCRKKMFSDAHFILKPRLRDESFGKNTHFFGQNRFKSPPIWAMFALNGFLSAFVSLIDLFHFFVGNSLLSVARKKFSNNTLKFTQNRQKYSKRNFVNTEKANKLFCARSN